MLYIIKFVAWLFGVEKPKPIPELPFDVFHGKHGLVYKSKVSGKFVKAADVRAYLDSL